ncbi:MAG: FliA/WhiG family RNA polymerase sigma factor [Firmicutes bacterium]|nr:FliA/WhiG family RNA polymerase sigma factor [Bacillota bacterium]
MAVGGEWNDLWSAYKAARDASTREKLVLRHAPLVKYVAGRLAMGLPAHIEVDDLISYGILGLLDAIEKYDPRRGVKFETYAIARIRGAMLDGLRALDWIPTSVRQKAREIERNYQALENKLGRPASDQEMAEAMGITVEEFQRRLAALGGASLVYLEDIWFGSEDEEGGFRAIEMIPDPEGADPAGALEFAEIREALAEAIDSLPEKERLVVALYYYEGLTVKEISRVMGVSPSRVSQLHTKAILRLRGRLSQHKTDLV